MSFSSGRRENPCKQSASGCCRADRTRPVAFLDPTVTPRLRSCRIRNVTAFSVATNEYIGNGREKAEYHSVITWDVHLVVLDADPSRLTAVLVRALRQPPRGRRLPA
jgi:hypothetical protein